MLDTTSFDALFVLDELRIKAAVAVPLLRSQTRKTLLEEAMLCHFRDKTGTVGKHGVRQEYGACTDFPPGSAFLSLGYCTKLLCHLLLDCGGTFAPAQLHFNDWVLQRYPPHSSGITPHLDGARYRNLIVIFPLEGDGDFVLCDDRSGRNSRVIHAPPGYVIFMATIGFCGRTEQQMHYLTNIKKGRLSFALRQIEPAP